MNLHLLRMFLSVVEQNSFSRAAEARFISQSAVSKGIRELEHQLDLPLIDRGAGAGMGQRGIRLTEGGAALFQHARSIFALERIAAEEVRDRVGLRKGRLRIGASTTVASYWLPSYISEFLRALPDIELSLVVGNTEEISIALIECRLDLAFVEGMVDDPRLTTTLWQQERLLLVTGASSPLGKASRVSMAQLQQQIWLMREPGSGTRQVAQAFLDAHGSSLTKVIEIGSNEAISRIVASGSGVALLPEAVVNDLLADGRLRLIKLKETDDLLRPLFRVELCNRPQPAAVRRFMQLAVPQSATA